MFCFDAACDFASDGFEVSGPSACADMVREQLDDVAARFEERKLIDKYEHSLQVLLD